MWIWWHREQILSIYSEICKRQSTFGDILTKPVNKTELFGKFVNKNAMKSGLYGFRYLNTFPEIFSKQVPTLPLVINGNVNLHIALPTTLTRVTFAYLFSKV